jgi:hypothetical protein
MSMILTGDDWFETLGSNRDVVTGTGEAPPAPTAFPDRAAPSL